MMEVRLQWLQARRRSSRLPTVATNCAQQQDQSHRTGATKLTESNPSPQLITQPSSASDRRRVLTLLALVHELNTLLDKLLGDVDEALNLVRHCGLIWCACEDGKEEKGGKERKVGRIRERRGYVAGCSQRVG